MIAISHIEFEVPGSSLELAPLVAVSHIEFEVPGSAASGLAAAITTQTFAGRRLTISGTTTGNPTGGQASITATAGAEAQSVGPVALTLTTNAFTAAFDLAPGDYAAPIVTINNGGSPVGATGGSVVRVESISGTPTAGLAVLAPTITTATLPAAAIGVAYSFAVGATGDAPLSWSITTGALPQGLSFNPATGTISGTPSGAIGDYTVTVRVTNAGGSDAKTFTLALGAAPAIRPEVPPAALLGVAYTFTLSATGSTPITWEIASGALPAGVTLSSAGLLSGTPSVSGSFGVTVRATNAFGQSTRSITVAVATVPVITTTALPGGVLGIAFNRTLLATGVPAPTWAVTSGGLPPGIVLDPATGQLSGAPTTMGTFNFSVTATTPAGSDTEALVIQIAAAPVAPTITTIELPGALQLLPYRTVLQATGDEPITWTVDSGALPQGLRLTGAVLEGTPLRAETATVTLRARNAAGTMVRTFSIVVTSIVANLFDAGNITDTDAVGRPSVVYPFGAEDVTWTRFERSSGSVRGPR